MSSVLVRWARRGRAGRERRSETRTAADRRRAPLSNLRPQARGHIVEALQFQSAKLLASPTARLAERGEFGHDVRVRRVHVDAELPGNLAVRAAGLPQFERERAALGDSLDLAASSATGSALRVCGVAPWPAAVEPAGKRDNGNPASWHRNPSSTRTAENTMMNEFGPVKPSTASATRHRPVVSTGTTGCAWVAFRCIGSPRSAQCAAKSFGNKAISRAWSDS